MSAPRWWVRAVDALPLLAVAYALQALFAAWSARRPYPYDLEWMEGGMLAHGWRLQRGLPVYAEPSADWVPYVYPPGYASLLAATGDQLGFSAGRSLSILGILAAATAIVAIVARHGRSLPLGLLAAGLFLQSYRATGAFMDLVRPDSVAVALGLWAVALTLDGRRGTPAAGGLLLCAAFLVKHNLAALGVPLALGLWAWRGWRGALQFGLTAAVPAAAMTAYLQWRSGGGFLTYLIAVPGSHPMFWDRGMPGSIGETANWLGLVVITSGLGLALAARHADTRVHPAVPAVAALAAGGLLAAWAVTRPDVVGAATPPRPLMGVAFFALGSAAGSAAVAALSSVVERKVDGRYWTAFGLLATTIGLSWLMRAHNGGFTNVLIPMHAAMCALFGVWLGRLRHRWPNLAAYTFGAALVGAQSLWLTSMTQLEPITPTPEDYRAGAEMVDALDAHCDGPIFSPFAAWLPVEVGQPPSTHLIAIWDIDHKRGPLHRSMKVFEAAMADHRFACVVEGGKQPLTYGVQKHYQLLRSVRVTPKALVPKTGWRVQPQKILTPNAVDR